MVGIFACVAAVASMVLAVCMHRRLVCRMVAKGLVRRVRQARRANSTLAVLVCLYVLGEAVLLAGTFSLATWSTVPLTLAAAWLFVRDRAGLLRPDFGQLRAAVRYRNLPVAKVAE